MYNTMGEQGSTRTVFICETFWRLVSLAIIVAMVVVGSLYVHDCPIQYMIPVYLIVYGIFLLLPTFTARHRRDGEDPPDVLQSPGQCCFQGIIGCFLLVWFIGGTSWVYPAFPVVDFTNTTSTNYCQPVLYNFAFTVTTATWVVAGVGLLASLCYLGLTLMRGDQNTYTDV
ncbi:transmembrane protein 272-like [Branchiostoma floridae x Branchiostoma japonicum]